MHNFASVRDHGNAEKLQFDWTRLYEALDNSEYSTLPDSLPLGVRVRLRETSVCVCVCGLLDYLRSDYYLHFTATRM